MDITSPTSQSPFAQENHRILLIDDNVAIHDDYRKILVGRAASSELDQLGAALFDVAPADERPANFEVSSAYQGQDGLSLVAHALEERRPFAIAFVDMRMPPGWDGVETIKRIWDVDPHLQVVICSAYSDRSWSELVDALPSVGQWLLLRKPFDSAEVSQLALALTKKWELERQSRERVGDLERVVAERTHELRQEMQSRLTAEQALRQNDARIRAVFDTTQSGIVIFDEAGKLECANRAACQMFGIEESELSQSNIVDLVVGPDGQSLAGRDPQHWGATLADLAGSHAECLVRSPRHTGIAVSVKVSCFISCSQRMFAALLQDLTSFKRLQHELAQANKLQAVGQLAAGVAHEINTPLQYLADNNVFFGECFQSLRELASRVDELDQTSGDTAEGPLAEIKQIVSDLRASNALDELSGALQDSTAGVRLVQEIVKSMRAVTDLHEEPSDVVDLAEVLAESIAEVRLVEPSPVEIITDFDPALPYIRGLAARLRDAFTHIVSNAVHATRVACLQNDLTEARVIVSAALKERWAEVAISDNGCGIPADVRGRIFEPFFTTKAVGEGRGQGLALARATIVDGHCGEIDFSSEKDHGTTFRVRLPIHEQCELSSLEPSCAEA